MEQAKKRDRKIMITDVALNKVPLVQVPEFTQVECETIAAEHRTLLRVAKEKNHSNEVLSVVSFKQVRRAMVLGDEFSVDLRKSPEAYGIFASAEPQEILLLHNHPSTNNFSLPDIVTLLRYAQVKMMSVVTNQGDVHILCKTVSFEYDTAKEIFNAVYCRYQGSEIGHHATVRRFLKECSKGGLAYVEG